MKEPYQDKYIYFVDGKEIVTEHSSLTGQDIKESARISRRIPVVLGKGRR